MAKRVLIYLEPGIFRDDPGLLGGHFEGFVEPLLRALSLNSPLEFLGVASNIFLSLGGLATARNLPAHPSAVRMYPLYNLGLLSGFHHSLEAYTQDVFGAERDTSLSPGLAESLSAIIEDARPDTVITTTQNRYLSELSRAHGFRLISLDHGLLPRLLYPGYRFMSLKGHRSEGVFSSAERVHEALKSVSEAGVQPLIQGFESDFNHAISQHPQYWAVQQLVQGLQRDASVAMLALQPTHSMDWEGVLGRRSTLPAIIMETLATLRTDKLVVTFPADPWGQINANSLREIWLSDPRLDLLPEELAVGMSDLFLPFVDELVTVSSSLAVTAFLLGKPVRAIGPSFARTLEALATDVHANGHMLLRGKLLRLLIDRMSVDDQTFGDPVRLRARLDQIDDGAHPTPVQDSDQAEALPPPHRSEDLRRADLARIHDSLGAHLPCDQPAARLLPLFGRHALGYLLQEGAVGAEFGVAGGFFSESLLRSGSLARLYSVDRWSDHHNDQEYACVQQRLGVFGDRSRILRMPFTDAIAELPDQSLDFLYVDGYAHTGHDAEVVRQCFAKLKPGALVAVHDYDRFSWPVNHRRLAALFSSDRFADRQVIPAVLTSNDEDMFPGMVARFVG